jgi:hypothetical protein
VQESTKRRLCLAPSEKPKAWEHVFEFVIPQRTYRLFSNSYDIKEQWVYVISEYLIYRQQCVKIGIARFSAQESNLDSNDTENELQQSDVLPGNCQGYANDEYKQRSNERQTNGPWTQVVTKKSIKSNSSESHLNTSFSSQLQRARAASHK